mmetsp:Transcript_3330/g.8037  ORF Transcript_3330/g.8037 Transcript_3330/m.8037 type:complete len:285 (-) Transcript_3330:492-1346(-)
MSNSSAFGISECASCCQGGTPYESKQCGATIPVREVSDCRVDALWRRLCCVRVSRFAECFEYFIAPAGSSSSLLRHFYCHVQGLASSCLCLREPDRRNVSKRDGVGWTKSEISCRQSGWKRQRHDQLQQSPCPRRILHKSLPHQEQVDLGCGADRMERELVAQHRRARHRRSCFQHGNPRPAALHRWKVQVARSQRVSGRLLLRWEPVAKCGEQDRGWDGVQAAAGRRKPLYRRSVQAGRRDRRPEPVQAARRSMAEPWGLGRQGEGAGSAGRLPLRRGRLRCR